MSECKSAHMYVCVFHRGGRSGGGEIYLSERRRIGDGKERGEGCAKKKKKTRRKANAERGRFIVE